jgi:signal transduction histidine kinase
MVMAMGGYVTVESEPGTTFSMHLQTADGKLPGNGGNKGAE